MGVKDAKEKEKSKRTGRIKGSRIINGKLVPPEVVRKLMDEGKYQEKERGKSVNTSQATQKGSAASGVAPGVVTSGIVMPGVVVVQFAPLEDGVNPIEQMIYLPDVLQAIAANTAKVAKELEILNGHLARERKKDTKQVKGGKKDESLPKGHIQV